MTRRFTFSVRVSSPLLTVKSACGARPQNYPQVAVVTHEDGRVAAEIGWMATGFGFQGFLLFRSVGDMRSVAPTAHYLR